MTALQHLIELGISKDRAEHILAETWREAVRVGDRVRVADGEEFHGAQEGTVIETGARKDGGVAVDFDGEGRTLMYPNELTIL